MENKTFNIKREEFNKIILITHDLWKDESKLSKSSIEKLKELDILLENIFIENINTKSIKKKDMER